MEIKTYDLTETEKASIKRDIATVEMFIAKEMSYSPDLRDNKYIASYKKVLTELRNMIATGKGRDLA